MFQSENLVAVTSNPTTRNVVSVYRQIGLTSVYRPSVSASTASGPLVASATLAACDAGASAVAAADEDDDDDEGATSAGGSIGPATVPSRGASG